MRTIFFLFIIFFISSSALSQVALQWASVYTGPGSGDDAATSIAVDNSGNVYVTGSSTSSGAGLNYVTVKYDPSGIQVWAAIYNGPANGNDAAKSIAVDNSGNVYVTGSSAGVGTGLDYATIKYNSAGAQQWVQRYNGPINSSDIARSIAVDNSGNVYITGQSVAGAVYDYATIKYNSAGVQQWVQRYNGPGNTFGIATSLAIDNSGNVYVTGGNGSISTGEDYATIKYNTEGVQQWLAIYNGPANTDDASNSIAVDNAGNVYVTGSSGGIGSGFDYATVKYNSAGVQQWVQRYNGTGNSVDIANSLAIDIAGNVFVTGSITGNGTGLDYATIKYNSSGVQQWVDVYGGTGNGDDAANSIAIDVAGNIYVTGSSTGSGFGFDYLTLKYNASGIRQWVQRYDGAGNSDDNAYSLTVDIAGNVYLTGGSTGNGSGIDYTTIKYSPLVGVTQISNSVPDVYKLTQNYPNPFNPSTKINFALTKTSITKLIIYDVLGREVTELVNSELGAGTYAAEWNAAGVSSGLYFYKLTSGNFAELRKMILVK